MILRIFIFSLVLIFSGEAYSQCVNTGGNDFECTGIDNDGLQTSNNADNVIVVSGAVVSLDNSPNSTIELQDGDDFIEVNEATISNTNATMNFGAAIEPGTGNNTIILNGATLIGNHGIRAPAGSNNKVIMNGGSINATTDNEEAIQFNGFTQDEIIINGGVLTASNGVIQASEANDRIIINGGILTQINDSDEVIAGEADDDFISIKNATLIGGSTLSGSVDGGAENDIIVIGTGTVLIDDDNGFNFISGGTGTDTLIFAQELFTFEECARVPDAIATLETPDGSITINGLEYDFTEFENIVDQTVCNTPAPTISQWGMIAFGFIAGIFGLRFLRKRELDPSTSLRMT